MSPAASRIFAALARHRTFADLRDEDAGYDLLKIATDGVQQTLYDETDPDGNPWPELSPAYDEWKSRRYPGKQMGHLSETMGDPEEVAGTPHVEESRAVVRYGKSPEAQEHATYFQIDRRFWGLTDESRRASREYLAARLKKKVSA